MTRKDFNLIANTFAAERPSITNARAYSTWERMVNAMARALADTSGYDRNGNRRFDTERFVTACKAVA